MRGSSVWLLLGLVVSGPAQLWGQTAPQHPGSALQAQVPSAALPSPTLQTRGNLADDDTDRLDATGHTNLPPEAEGQYPWNKNGGRIEMYFVDGKLNGYMTEHVDPNPHAAPLTYKFLRTHIDGDAVEFTTQTVHGAFYTFVGHLERGQVNVPTEPGYYLLAGSLVVHGGQVDGLKETVSLKQKPDEF